MILQYRESDRDNFPDEVISKHLEAIKCALSEVDTSHQPLGPLLDYITSPQAKALIPNEALCTFFVVFFSVEDLAAVTSH